MIKKLLAAAALVSVAGTAQAASFVFAPGGDLNASQPLLTNFNNAADDALVTGTNFAFLTTDSSMGAIPASGDQSRYLSILNNGSASIDFGGAQTGFSLTVGSLDSFNSIILNLLDGTTQTFMGSQLTVNANGDQEVARTNGRLNFFTSGAERITGITLASGGNSFEVDDLSIGIGAVPEPTTWAMMLVGFGAVGMSMRRRPARRRVQAV